MRDNSARASRNAMLLGIATTVVGLGVLFVSRAAEARVLRVNDGEPSGKVPLWARASAIVASSASALLLLAQQRE